MKMIGKILALCLICVGILACNLGNMPPGTSETEPTLAPSETPIPTQSSPTQQETDTTQPSGEMEPCSLVTTTEAEAVLAEAVSAPSAMNGSCAYSNASNGLYTISVAAAQEQQTNGILQGQAMLLGLAGVQLDEARMNKLRPLAEALDYKGFFSELVTAAQGSTTFTAKLIEGTNNDLEYWAWITAQSRRQGAFVAVRGQTLVNINLVVADTRSEEEILTAATSLADAIFGRLPAKFTLAVPTVVPTQQAQPLPTPTEVLPVKTIVGSWVRRSTDTTEYFDIQSNGDYSIEARKNSTNEIIASMSGTLTYDGNNIYYVDKDNRKSTESYYLDNKGDLLVINNQIERAWTRVQ